MPFLQAEKIAMSFGGVPALKGVDLTAERGEFITLLGPSGCGKTTLLNIIAGFLRPTGGRLQVDGRDIATVPPEQRDSAMCFQSYALFPHLSVADNIAFGPRQRRLAARDVDQRVTGLIGQMGLGAHATKLPNALSGGQQQRVALARALAVAPGLVLFDEPLSNLDARLRDQVRAEIRNLQREVGFTAIYVTHDQAEALALSDRIYVLNHGVVEQQGAPRDLYFRPRTRFVADFIGAANLHDGMIAGGVMQTPFGAITGQGLRDGQGTLCWRPEMARLADGGLTDQALTGTVASVAFQGAHCDVFVTAGGQVVRLQLPGGVEPVPGSTISFAVSAQDVVQLMDGPV
jgi:iron(III) transport system ATP-binding protein